MAEAVDLTTAAELGIQVSVENAIQNVLGNTDSNMTMAAAQDIVNLENTISRKFKALTNSITDVAKGISNLRSSQDETARQSADAALAAEEQNSPLGRMADTLDDILLFLQEKFKPTGLGTEDANVGMLAPREDEPAKLEEQKKKEEKAKADSGSIFVAGTLTAAALTAIKDKIDETWSGVTMAILKPYIAIKEALKGLPKVFDSLKTRISNFTGKVWRGFQAKFPKLAKFIDRAVDSVRGFKDSIVKAVKNFNLGRFFKPLFDSIKSVAGGGGFGKVIGILKKFALPLTLVMEAFEAFKMIFVGSFSKNAQALSDSISDKGVLGQAWYGFTHMFQTIATFGYEVVETFKAVSEAAHTFFDPIKNGFEKLMDELSSIYITMYNAIASKSMGLLDVIPTKEMEEMDRRSFLKQGILERGGSAGQAEMQTEALINRGAKVGVELEDGDDERTFKARIKAAEKAKKMQEDGATLKKTNPEPYGVGRYQNQQNIQQNSIQNNTNIEVQMPSAGDMLNQ